MRAVLITGACGGIGRALASTFAQDGWRVIGTDTPESVSRTGTPPEIAAFLPVDLAELARDDTVRSRVVSEVRAAVTPATLGALVNNAAVQILGGAADIALSDWERSFQVNVTAPFRLAQGLLEDLEAATGTIVNIGSVHAQATKPGFVAYATTKAALHGLTRALAVDLGPRIRVVCLAPAAVATPMLLAGFDGQPDAFAALAQAHPAGRIGEPDEVARAATVLAGGAFSFSTGATFWLDGGVLSRLHDPA